MFMASRVGHSLLLKASLPTRNKPYCQEKKLARKGRPIGGEMAIEYEEIKDEFPAREGKGTGLVLAGLR